MIAESGVRMDLLHESREVRRRIVLMDSLVVGHESIFNRAFAFDGEQCIDRTLYRGEAVVLDFFEGGDVRLGGPDRGLRHGNFLCEKKAGQNKRKAEKQRTARDKQHEILLSKFPNDRVTRLRS